MSGDNESRPLWERQDWDTDASYARFVEFYLPLSPPRSLDEAYNQYYAAKTRQEGGKPDDKRRRPTGTWYKWAAGQNSKGEHIPGAVPWAERAAAYDNMMLQEHTLSLGELWKAEQARELGATDKMLAIFHAMLDDMPMFLREFKGARVLAREHIEKDDKHGRILVRDYEQPVALRLNFNGLSAAARIHADLMVQRRVALGMPLDGTGEAAGESNDPDNISENMQSALDELKAGGWLDRDYELPNVPEGLDKALSKARLDAQIPARFADYNAGEEPDSSIDDPADHALPPGEVDEA